MPKAWENQVDFYNIAGRSKAKSVEDKIARRVLNALGYKNSEKGLASFEEEYFGGPSYDEPIWNRTARVVSHLAYNLGGWSGTLQAMERDSAKELSRRIALSASKDDKVFYFVLKGDVVKVYWSCFLCDVTEFKPPFTVLPGPDGRVIMEMGIKNFIATEVRGDNGDE